MVNRRQFLGAIGLPLAIPAVPATLRAGFDWGGLCRELGSDRRPAATVADDEDFWLPIQRAYTCDRSLINLNNGGVSPSPDFVVEAQKRHLDLSNQAPAYHMWRVLEPQREGVRQRLARELGCDAEEVALTRNASEGLQICQLGFDLKRGDEVLTTTQDYGRMLATFEQRERRDGIVLKKISIPTPCEDPGEIVRRFTTAVTERTRLILCSHVINLTGQVVPVKELAALGRERGIPVLVDGAHAFAHLPFQIADLGCDYYATSLHKWLCAPHGTGLLFVRKEKIAALWPMQPAPAALQGDIRKFEEIGTHPAAGYLAIAEALTFHQAIGVARKHARLQKLRDHWARRLTANPRVTLRTSLVPGHANGLATFTVEGVDPRQLEAHLWDRCRILTVAIVHDEFAGIRVSPHVYTTVEMLDRFCEAVERVLRDGLGGAGTGPAPASGKKTGR